MQDDNIIEGIPVAAPLEQVAIPTTEVSNHTHAWAQSPYNTSHTLNLGIGDLMWSGIFDANGKLLPTFPTTGTTSTWDKVDKALAGALESMKASITTQLFTESPIMKLLQSPIMKLLQEYPEPEKTDPMAGGDSVGDDEGPPED